MREARAWRARAQVELGRGRLDAPCRTTLRDAAELWLVEARAGVVRTRSGDRYKPSALRSYEQALNARLLPRFGDKRLSALSRLMLQELVDELVAQGCAPSTVRNAVLPLPAIYRRALQRQELTANPTLKLLVPAVRERRERVARPAEAEALLEALPADQRALWATALYAGLRRGELQALRWQNVDLERGVINVEHSWDRCAGLIEPKSRSGVRRVPIPAALRTQLLAHRLRRGRPAAGFVFLAADQTRPFDGLGHRQSAAHLAGRRSHAARAARMPPHLRRLRDRRRHQRQGTQQLHGPQLDHRHARPLPTPHARQRS